MTIRLDQNTKHAKRKKVWIFKSMKYMNLFLIVRHFDGTSSVWV